MTPWHAPHELLVRFATRPEAIAEVDATSVETHLVNCATCRAVVADNVDLEWLEQSWLALVDEVDRPKRTVGERALGWFVGDSVARVVASTRALRWAWFAAVAFVSVVLVAISRNTDSLAPFLLVGPALPLAGVGLTFEPMPDPGGEAALATPMQGEGLVLRRALAVLVTTVAVMVPAAAWLPGAGWSAFAWLLPALALTALALGLCTWVAPNVAVGVVAGGWVAALYVSVMGIFDDHDRIVDIAFGPVAQLGWLAATGLAAITIATRSHHFSMLEAR